MYRFRIIISVIFFISIFICGGTVAAGPGAGAGAGDCAPKGFEETECTVNGLSGAGKGTAAGAAAIRPADLPADVTPNCYIKPCVLDGDFDGDGRGDRLVLVADKKSQKKGIVALLGNGKKVTLGAGHPLGLAGDDFSWLDSWAVVPKAGHAKADQLSLGKAAALSGLVSWQGGRFKWAPKPL